MSEIPTQVRIRTDADDGYGHRYDAIQSAKTVFDVGNNTAAVVNACDHAQEDVRAKADALEYLAEHVPADVLQETAARLGTRALPLAVETSIHSDHDAPRIDVQVGDVEE